MRKYSDDELKVMLTGIIRGAKYGGIKNNRGAYGTIYLTENLNIGWTHYGSSANKCTIKELRWILENIFEDCDEVVPVKFSAYHINDTPIDNKYSGLDLSTAHPNVCGL